jgi:hypothetical protein
MSGRPSVTTIVCSTCAAGAPSAVRAPDPVTAKVLEHRHAASRSLAGDRLADRAHRGARDRSGHAAVSAASADDTSRRTRGAAGATATDTQASA